MSDSMKDFINEAAGAEIKGDREKAEAGVIIEVDDDDLAMVAGGMAEYNPSEAYKKRFAESWKKDLGKRPKKEERPSTKRKKKYSR